MDAREFYAQIDKADDELKAVSFDIYKISRDTIHVQHMFSDLSEKAEEIEDEEKRERFESVLSSLSEQSYKCDELWHDISAYFANTHYYDSVELVAMAEEMAKEEEGKGLSEADNN